jgi:hypothetical protein
MPCQHGLARELAVTAFLNGFLDLPDYLLVRETIADPDVGFACDVQKPAKGALP